VDASTGLAFPVHAERGRCGLVVFTGGEMTLEQDALYDIHARCFSLFSAVSRIRPGDTGLTRAISRRELECLKLTANGYTSEEIAGLLKLSVHTANQYLTQSAQKLNAVSRMQAVAKALRLGLIE
jgi:DNA-binding CsgD family transcriptional regulator